MNIAFVCNNMRIKMLGILKGNLMKILVMSDSHGDAQPILRTIRVYERYLTTVVHLGDADKDLMNFADEFPVMQFYAARGASDSCAQSEKEQVLSLCGKKIMITHGHEHRVNIDTQRLAYYAQEKEVDACLYGHTHMAATFTVGPIFFLNPGSIAKPRGGGKPSYGIVEITGNGLIRGAIITLTNESMMI